MMDLHLTQADQLVLANLINDVHQGEKPESLLEKDSETGTIDQVAVDRLKALNDADDPAFQPTVFVFWDEPDIPEVLNQYVVRRWARVAATIVRHPTDVVFLTNVLVYLVVNLPSAVYLFVHFTYLHGFVHAGFTLWCIGSFTLMLHQHLHAHGILKKQWPWTWLDFAFPYITEPLMGHTWDSYLLHHRYHHHIEGNGPRDLSSTIRYQRDDMWHLLHYVGRFLFFVWAELPLYFISKGKYKLAARSLISELSSYAFLYCMTRLNWRASIFIFIVPFVLLRLGLMVGNWGQHAFIDESEPDSDYRSSITLIDVASNRHSYNDGYHVSHHLNPLRHWREHPVHFLQHKAAYREGRALVFQNIDYLMVTYRLVRKDYAHLAKCLVPMGDQIGMSQQEVADMLRLKTRKFTEEEIAAKFK